MAIDMDAGRGAVRWLALAWSAAAFGALTGAVAGLRPLGVALVALLAPSAATALVVIVVAASSRRSAEDRRTSGARRRAAARVSSLEARLAAVHRQGGGDGLRGVPLAVDLHRARLAYAKQVLREHGRLPAPLADELLDQHRALLDLVDRSLPDRRGSAGY